MNRRQWMVAVAVLGLGCCGCQSLPFNSQKAGESAGIAATESAYFIDVESDWFGKRHMSKPFRDGMTVQDGLEQSGALMTMRNVEVDVVRQEGHQLIRMPCRYDVSQRHIAYEQDYALRANDRLVIRQKQTNVLESALKSLGADR